MEATSLEIRKAVVVGAGTMGAQIAALLANVGIPSLLLDVVPSVLTEEETRKRLTLEDPSVRNRITRTLWERALKLSPSPLFDSGAAALVSIGNVEDDLDGLADADWIIEAVVERLEVKKAIHAQIAANAREDAVVTTNTSGIPITAIAEAMPEGRRPRFFGSHFFNPPRLMRLVEMIPGPQTDPAFCRAFANFAEETLGKGAVFCKDTPGFISNRIGYFAIQQAIWQALEEGLTIEEVDAITGPAMGRPKSAIFRLCDLIGIDLMAQIGRDLLERLPADERNRFFGQPAFVKMMIERGWLGEKSGQGYYKRIRSEKGSEIQALDLAKLEYRAAQPASFPSLKGGIRALCAADDKAGRFAWKHLSSVLRYSADKLYEIADDVVSVDRVLRWGFNWQMGPFEIWDTLGVRETADRMEKEGDRVPEAVVRLIQSEKKSFYERRGARMYFFGLPKGDYEPVPVPPSEIHLHLVREDNKVVLGNAGASLLDLGDGVACLEFHSKMNALGPDQLEIIEKGKEEVRKNFAGLVVGNQGKHFSAGVNLNLFVDHIRSKAWNKIDQLLHQFQQAACGWRWFEKPVFVTCHGYTLGAGCEMALGADHLLIGAETYMGLPEVRVGLIPSAGGCKEILVRAMERLRKEDLFCQVESAWKIIFSGRISSCAHEAISLGYLGPYDALVMLDAGNLIGEAKAEVLEQCKKGYRASPPRQAIRVLGAPGFNEFREKIDFLCEEGKIGEHDAVVGRELAYVLCGGDKNKGGYATEQEILDLEREAFLRLCGQPKTLERIEHMLKTGKPLRN